MWQGGYPGESLARSVAAFEDYHDGFLTFSRFSSTSSRRFSRTRQRHSRPLRSPFTLDRFHQRQSSRLANSTVTPSLDRLERQNPVKKRCWAWSREPCRERTRQGHRRHWLQRGRRRLLRTDRILPRSSMYQGWPRLREASTVRQGTRLHKRVGMKAKRSRTTRDSRKDCRECV